jgi:hypothetical protein
MSVSHSAAADQLNASLRVLRSGDLAQALDLATKNIDGWIQQLRASGETAHATISADLVQLKGYLSGPDASPISDTLQTLAEHVNSIVDGADPRFIGPLDELAKALAATARILQGQSDAEQQ